MPCSVVDPVIVDVRKQCKDAEIIPGCMMIDSSNIMMEEFLSDCESCLFFNFEECTRKEDVAQIHSSVANGDNSWLQYEFIEISSYVALISDASALTTSIDVFPDYFSFSNFLATSC